MEKSILDALKTVVEEHPPELYERRKSVILMNEKRQDIMGYLCSHPCTHLRKIARDMKLGNRVLQFHLDRLIDGNFASMKKVGNKVVYYPSGMLSLEGIELRTILNRKTEMETFLYLTKNPGISQGELCSELSVDRQKLRKVLRTLQKHGLIDVISDGRFRRHYPSEQVSKLVSLQKKQIRAFRQTLLRNMKSDGLSPQIVRAGDQELHVKVSSGKKARILYLPLDPFRDIQIR